MDLDRGARLRERLIELRDDALGRMLRRCAVEPGHLPLIAGINAALDALDGMPTDADTPSRSVVSDDGGAIRLTLYTEAGAAPHWRSPPAAASRSPAVCSTRPDCGFP